MPDRRHNAGDEKQKPKRKMKTGISKTQIEVLKYYAGLISKDERPSNWINTMRSLIKKGLMDENRDPIKSWVNKPAINEKGLAALQQA
jgi:hypothetical protein